MATPRKGKPYVWATWAAKVLGGAPCQYQYWFATHYQYNKCEEMASDLAQWNKEHNELMDARAAEMEEAGFVVRKESENSFKLEGKTGTVLAGKPDLSAAMVAPTEAYTFVIDGKTGTPKDSDIWQVKIYLYALPKCRPDLIYGKLEGEVQYKRGDVRKSVTLTPDDELAIVNTIKKLAAPDPPVKVPSRDSCKYCNIGKADCPDRMTEDSITGRSGDF